MERLITVWEAWDPKSGVPFGAFAAQAIDWEIQDFMKQLRRQVPVQRSINLNDPVDNTADEDDDEKPPEPERPDMMKFNAMETQAAAARRRLVADRLGCLNLREQRVIEGRLALNGYKYPVGHEGTCRRSRYERAARSQGLRVRPSRSCSRRCYEKRFARCPLCVRRVVSINKGITRNETATLPGAAA